MQILVLGVGNRFKGRCGGDLGVEWDNLCKTMTSQYGMIETLRKTRTLKTPNYLPKATGVAIRGLKLDLGTRIKSNDE